MTLARGAVLGALLAVVAVIAILVLSSGGGEQYRLIFQNAGQLVKGDDVQIGGRRVGSVDDILLTDDNQAEVDDQRRRAVRAAARGHDGDDPPDLAVRRREPLHRARARARTTTPELPDGARLGVEQTTSVVDLDQIFNTFDARTRRGLQQFIQGSAVQYAGKGPEVNESAKYFNPFLSTTDAAREGADARPRRRSSARVVAGASVTSAVAERAPQLTSLITNLNAMMGAIARENASLSQALGVLPGHAAPGQLDVRRPALDARRPRPAAGGVEAVAATAAAEILPPAPPAAERGDADVHETSARSSTQPGPVQRRDRRVRRTCRALQRIGSPAFSSSITAMRKGQPVIDFLRPYSPDLVGWFRDFGQARRQLRRERPLRARDADLRHLRVPANGAAPSAQPGPAVAAAGRPGERLHAPLPRRRQPAAARRLEPVRAGRLRLRPRATCSPAHEIERLPSPQARARRRPRCCSRRSSCWSLGTGASGDDGGSYRVRAIFDSASFLVPGEDVKVAGVKIGTIESLDVTQDNKAAIVLRIDDPAFQDFKQDAHCTIRLQSLIGEKFVACKPTQPKRRGRAAVAAAAQDHRTATARASTCCR